MTRAPVPERASFRWFTKLGTRFSDNDIFGHVNNAVYYSYMDTAICRFLYDTIDYDPYKSAHLVFAAENGCQFFDGLTYPDMVDVGLAIDHLGNSSFKWRIGIFRESDAQAAAVGFFAHVLVDRQTRRPATLPAKWRAGLETILSPAGQ